MKRYLIFRGEQYYPSPGMQDFLTDADTINEAIDLLRAERDEDDFDWAHIYDTEQREIVWQTGVSLYAEYGDYL
jgi:hypothetical protein